MLRTRCLLILAVLTLPLASCSTTDACKGAFFLTIVIPGVMGTLTGWTDDRAAMGDAALGIVAGQAHHRR